MLSFLVSTPDFKKKSHLNFVIDHEERNPSHWDKNSFPLWTRGRECDDSHVGWRQRQQNLSANHAFSLERLPHLSQSSISILLQWCFFLSLPLSPVFVLLCYSDSLSRVLEPWNMPEVPAGFTPDVSRKRSAEAGSSPERGPDRKRTCWGILTSQGR